MYYKKKPTKQISAQTGGEGEKTRGILTSLLVNVNTLLFSSSLCSKPVPFSMFVNPNAVLEVGM